MIDPSFIPSTLNSRIVIHQVKQFHFVKYLYIVPPTDYWRLNWPLAFNYGSYVAVLYAQILLVDRWLPGENFEV